MSLIANLERKEADRREEAFTLVREIAPRIDTPQHGDDEKYERVKSILGADFTPAKLKEYAAKLQRAAELATVAAGHDAAAAAYDQAENLAWSQSQAMQSTIDALTTEKSRLRSEANFARNRMNTCGQALADVAALRASNRQLFGESAPAPVPSLPVKPMVIHRVDGAVEPDLAGATVGKGIAPVAVAQ